MSAPLDTLGFLHTSPVHVPTFEALVAEAAPGTLTAHVVDESLLDRARADGLTPAVVAATDARLAELAEQGCAVVVVTCSTIGGVAESYAAAPGAPAPLVLRVDRPMAREAVAVGRRVGVVAALESTLAPTEALIREEAARTGSDSRQAPNRVPTAHGDDTTVEIVRAVAAQAWSAFESGDSDAYLELVADAARTLAGRVDVVVLAQASMAAAVDRLRDLGVPVLASPATAVRAALDALPSHTSRAVGRPGQAVTATRPRRREGAARPLLRAAPVDGPDEVPSGSDQCPITGSAP